MTDQTTQTVPAAANADIEASVAVALLAGAAPVAAHASATPPPASPEAEANEEDPGVRDQQIAELAAMIMALFPGETDPFSLGWGKAAPLPPAPEWFADMPFDDRLRQLACADV